MEKETTIKPDDHGQILLSWQFPEYPIYNRGKRWLVTISAIGILLIIWSLFTNNFLFAIIVIIVGVILVAQSRRRPHKVTIQITEDGLGVGQSFYQYSDIKNFWFAYDPPLVKKLFIRFKTAIRPSLPIQLENENPVNIRRILKKYIDEDLEQETEPTSDSISRLMKI
ncbi:MAG: hypothetical protein V1838_04225 [Patescibacteria group bacterium]